MAVDVTERRCTSLLHWPAMAKQTTPKPKAAKVKQANPAAVDAWLAKLPSEQQPVMQCLREHVLAAASPDVVETVAYGVPMYYVGMSQLFGFGAFKSHLSIGLGKETIDALGAELDGYEVTMGTVRFTPDRPLPAALVKKLVKTCIALHAAAAED